MPRGSATKGARAAQQFLAHEGVLKNAATDEDVTDAPPQELMIRVSLTCDDDTGVFFFRHNRRLFMRVVESS